jgi:hypothetical protein
LNHLRFKVGCMLSFCVHVSIVSYTASFLDLILGVQYKM